MKQNEDEVNCTWASEQKEDPGLNIEMETRQSICEPEESVKITTTHRSYSSKNTSTFVCLPPRRKRYFRPTFPSKKKRRGRKFAYYRSAYQYLNRSLLKKRLSILENKVLNKRFSSRSLFPYQLPQRSLSRIVVTEETICMDSASKDKTEVRRSSYRRVSAVHFHESNKPPLDRKVPLIENNTKGGDSSISRAFRRLMRPRKKNVRIQTSPEPEPPPPPSPTESEKEIDFTRRLEIFKRSKAYRRLTAPPKQPLYVRIFSEKGSSHEKLDETHEDLETKCIYPPPNSSRLYKVESRKRKILRHPFYSLKTMALIEGASPPASSKSQPKSIAQMASIRPYRSKRVFDRLTSVKTSRYPHKTRPGNSNISDFINVGTDSTFSRPGNSKIPYSFSTQFHPQCSQQFTQQPLLTVPRNSICFQTSSNVQSLKELKVFPPVKVYERLTTPHKQHKESFSEKHPLIVKTSSEESCSSWKKLKEFQSSRAYERLTNPRTRPNGELIWEKVSTKEFEESSKEQGDDVWIRELEGEEEGKKKPQSSSIYHRLIASRKTSSVSNWGRESTVKQSFTFQKFKNILTNSLKPDSFQEAGEKPSPRTTSAFRRLTEPKCKGPRHVGISPTFKSLNETKEPTLMERRPILKNFLKDAQNINDKKIKSEASRSLSKIHILSAVSSVLDERPTDTSFETISETSDVSETTYGVSDVSHDSEFEDHEIVPQLHRFYPSFETRAECNHILGEIATLKKKMAQRMSQMAYEIYDGSRCMEKGKEQNQDRNKSGIVWVPLQPTYDWEIRNTKERWSELTTTTSPSV